MSTPEQVASSLKTLILDNFNSLKEFASQMKISPSNLSNILAGKSFMSPKNAFKFANILHLNPRFLAFGEEPQTLTDAAMLRFTYSVKPAILASLNTTTEENEFINLMLSNYSPLASMAHISFNNDVNGRFAQMIDAALSLASRVIDLSLLDGSFNQEFYNISDMVPIYKSYGHLFDGLLIKSDSRKTFGYIQLFIKSDFLQISDFRQDELIFEQ